MDLDKLKYPIGKFNHSENFGKVELQKAIRIIGAFPSSIKEAVGLLNDDQLNTRYRAEGWTIRQVVHHCADSHMNSFMRYKFALTEDNPTIKAYEEQLWAELEDGKTFSIEPSIKILEGIHARWTALLTSMSDTDFKKTYIHPATQSKVSLLEATALYAWHCNHHLAHINKTIQREKWNS